MKERWTALSPVKARNNIVLIAICVTLTVFIAFTRPLWLSYPVPSMKSGSFDRLGTLNWKPCLEDPVALCTYLEYVTEFFGHAFQSPLCIPEYLQTISTHPLERLRWLYRSTQPHVIRRPALGPS